MGEGVQDRGQGGRDPLARPKAGHAIPGNLKGIAAMVAATAVFTCGDAAMKLVSDELPTGESVFLRGVSTVTIVTIAAFWTGAIYRLRDGVRALHGLAQPRRRGQRPLLPGARSRACPSPT